MLWWKDPKKCTCPMSKQQYVSTHSSRSSRGEIIEHEFKCSVCGKRNVQVVRKFKSHVTHAILKKKIQVIRKSYFEADKVIFQADNIEDVRSFIDGLSLLKGIRFEVTYTYETPDFTKII